MTGALAGRSLRRAPAVTTLARARTGAAAWPWRASPRPTPSALVPATSVPPERPPPGRWRPCRWPAGHADRPSVEASGDDSCRAGCRRRAGVAGGRAGVSRAGLAGGHRVGGFRPWWAGLVDHGVDSLRRISLLGHFRPPRHARTRTRDVGSDVPGCHGATDLPERTAGGGRGGSARGAGAARRAATARRARAGLRRGRRRRAGRRVGRCRGQGRRSVARGVRRRRRGAAGRGRASGWWSASASASASSSAWASAWWSSWATASASAWWSWWATGWASASGSTTGGVGSVTTGAGTAPITRVAAYSRDQRTTEILTTSPVVGACTILPLPMYMPTWWIVVQLLPEAKKSRSPGSSALCGTVRPRVAAYWSRETRGRSK